MKNSIINKLFKKMKLKTSSIVSNIIFLFLLNKYFFTNKLKVKLNNEIILIYLVREKINK